MVDLVIRPSGLEAPKPKWSLQLRWHESVGETEYHTLARINDDLAEEIIRAGAASYLFSDTAEPSAPLYVLRRKSDHKLMPNFKGRAGGTYVDPDDPSTHDGLPRLFASKKAAENALVWWVKGKARVVMQSFDVFDPPEPAGLCSDAVEGRSAADWEVVPVGLHTR
jgi:hypothetical protein